MKIDTIYNKSCQSMSELADNSINLIVTDPLSFDNKCILWYNNFIEKKGVIMPKSNGYKNLELGRGWNKGKDGRKKLICKNCGGKFKRYKTQIKGANVFCSPSCKAEGMSKGLVADMRKGTGCDELTKYCKKKYYKYWMLDKQKNFDLPDYSVWDLVKRLKNGRCHYCGDTMDLGLDRIDNNKGHVLENTVISCEICNMTRGDRFSVKQMRKIGVIISSFKKGSMNISKLVDAWNKGGDIGDIEIMGYRQKKEERWVMSNLPLERIMCKDCLKGMKELPDDSIDLICTDPPY